MYKANNYKGHDWFSCLLNLMHDANLVPLDGPPTLVPTHQAVWRLPGTQGRLVHLWARILLGVFPGLCSDNSILSQKVGRGQTKFLFLVGYNFVQSQTSHFERGGVSGKIQTHLDVSKTTLVYLFYIWTNCGPKLAEDWMWPKSLCQVPTQYWQADLWPGKPELIFEKETTKLYVLLLRDYFLFTCEFESQGLFSQAAGDNDGDGVLEENFCQINFFAFQSWKTRKTWWWGSLMSLVRITVGLPRCLPNQAPLRKPEQEWAFQLSETMKSFQNMCILKWIVCK